MVPTLGRDDDVGVRRPLVQSVRVSAPRGRMALTVAEQRTRIALGIDDSNGAVIGGTGSSGRGKRVSVDFKLDSEGRYYISVGSEGDDWASVGEYRGERGTASPQLRPIRSCGAR